MILQRYIFKELTLAFLLAFAVVTAVCLVGMAFQILREFDALGLIILARALPTMVGYVLPWTLLVASCTATTLVYGRMAAENEIDAMRMSGIHANRMLAPALLFGLALSGLGYVINEFVFPAAHYSHRSHLREKKLALLKLPPPGDQSFSVGNYQIHYTDYKDERMIRPFLRKTGPRGLEAEYHALEGSVIVAPGKPPTIILSKPTIKQYGADGGKDTITADGDLSIPIQMEEIYQAEKRADDMRQHELWEAYSQAPSGHKKAALLTAIHSRYAQAITPLLLVLVAVPIGIFVKRGSRLAGLGAALPPLLLYFVLFFVFQGLAEKDSIPSALAAYAPPASLLALALFLLGGAYRK